MQGPEPRGENRVDDLFGSSRIEVNEDLGGQDQDRIVAAVEEFADGFEPAQGCLPDGLRPGICLGVSFRLRLLPIVSFRAETAVLPFSRIL